MKLFNFRAGSSVFALSFFSVGIQATPADIPASLSGIYELAYTHYSGTPPFASNAVLGFAINGSDESMCVDGEKLENAYHRTAGASEILLADTQSDLYYGLSTAADGSLNEINVYAGSDEGDNWVGQFTGSLTSASVDCASTGLSISAEARALFDLASELYPDLFSNPSELREAQGYIYRFFADSGIYVGIQSETVSLLGGPFGNSIVSKGAINDVMLVLEGIKADLDLAATPEMLNLFDLAEIEFPNLFTGGSELRTSADGYLYRVYENSGIRAAIKNGSVFLKGGIYGSVYTNVGELNALLDQLEGSGGNEILEIPEGEFTLTVTGVVSIMGISSGLNFVIEDVLAPDINDQQAIKDAFEASLEDAEGLVINDFEYNLIDSSANHVEFAVTVDATVNGVSFEYVLNYEYSR